MEGVLGVADLLSLDDQVSLAFLLGSDATTTLHTIQQLVSAASQQERHGIFKQFLIQFSFATQEDAFNLIIEALSIIQNYRICRLLNVQKQDLVNYTGKLNLIKKQLYELIDSLNQDETCALISNVEETKVEKCRHLEQYLLNWQIRGVLSPSTELDASSVQFLEKHFPKKLNNRIDINEEWYPIIDKSELGFCIVINNSQFTRNNEYKELLPQHNLSPRRGSEADVKEIVKTFQNLKFLIKSHENVDYKQLRELLATYSKSVANNHSCIVLAIMSHGTENVFYTADSIPVSVEALEMAFQRNNCPQLTGKPKILVIQACQGKDLQKVVLDGENYPAKLDIPLMGPERGDALIAWSTVKGYASFRDINEGSWFIQELCRELQLHSKTRDLVDIVTRVNNNLRTKTYHGVFMVPSLSTSLCKKIKFFE